MTVRALKPVGLVTAPASPTCATGWERLAAPCEWNQTDVGAGSTASCR